MPTTCIPFAGGVPAAGGPPVWWDTTSGSEPSFNQRIDDPRWRGATAKSYPTGGGGAGEHATFRALYHTDGGATSLYLTWFVKVDPVLSTGGDRLFVGFSRPGGTPIVARILPFASQPSGAQQAVSVGSVATYQRVGGSWTPTAGGSALNWVPTYARAWYFPSPNKWAINVRVPLLSAGDFDDTGINLGSVGATFRMWYELQVLSGTTVTRHTWSRSASMFSATNFPDPASASWDDFVLGSSPGACTTGVSLAVLDVGTTNTPSSRIRWSRTDPTVTNTFFAQPLNATGATIPASTAGTTNLSARFRMANWGSMADWNDVANPNDLWSDIPGGSNVANASAISDGTKGNLTFNWQLSSSEIDQFDPPGGGTPNRRSHQCVLVELTGQGLDFINDSVYRNMDVVSASTFKRDAEVSVVGLGSLGPPKRNVYLYVEAMNMPKNTSGKGEPPRGDEGPQRGDGEAASLRSVARTHQPPEVTLDDRAAAAPTYRVHVLHETGESVDQDGVSRPELRPQTSFGYFLDHQGDLYGWDHKLKGPWLIEIAPNFYRVKVPNEGKVTVSTEIKAWEKPRPWWWWLWELLLRIGARIKSWIGRLLGK